MISLELNELNIDYVEKYIEKGLLPNFSRLISKGYFRTTSEKSYPLLEPWIQWPTFYTGLQFEDHKIFRLGDAVNSGFTQIWEEIESLNSENSVMAVSPMNADNRIKNVKSIFLPDPWTNTKVSVNSKSVERVYEWARNAVQNNATTGMSLSKFFKALIPLLAMLDGKTFLQLINQSFKIFFKREKFRKALVLDILLFRIFQKQSASEHFVYKSLFLNAGAHLQHHYAFSSDAYDGDQANPIWYTKKTLSDSDPLLSVYEVYDWVLGELISSKEEFFVSTGLCQKPNEKPFHQYRLKNPELLLSLLGFPEGSMDIRLRMSRDFEVVAQESALLHELSNSLDSFKVNGSPLFKIDPRDNSLFVQVAFNLEPEKLKNCTCIAGDIDATDMLSHVSIENQIHIGEGYVLDPFEIFSNSKKLNLPLHELKNQIISFIKTNHSVNSSHLASSTLSTASYGG